MNRHPDTSNTSANSSGLIGTTEAMRLVGYRNKSRFLDLAKREGLPHYKIGSAFKYKKPEIESWINSRKVGGQSR
ncbi:hypothetical protein SH580_19680 [Coraliomargarita algicola]|uniref:Helix-turn-helix domain-containing protein n=1 Tax=Coraliomargarita algicola TaxID=3092156 RepID=A0ABZ0RHV9_9BACT|nr:hypothetical protein [Coraliomargarita sp. J2-16]WPJ95642.1 hypothetical protein SH580_19680 [Coraliomargarita sp. J2-16]